MEKIYRIVGERIRARRLQLGLTLEALEGLSNLHASFIGQIERNEKKSSLRTIARLAEALQVPVASLFGSHHTEQKSPLTAQLELILGANSSKKQKIILRVVRHLSRDLKGMT